MLLLDGLQLLRFALVGETGFEPANPHGNGFTDHRNSPPLPLTQSVMLSGQVRSTRKDIVANVALRMLAAQGLAW